MAKVSKEYNLSALYPGIAKQWHPTKNGDLTPDRITPFSEKKVWWLCNKGHATLSIVGNKTRLNSGCIYCAGQKVGYGNDLKSNNPKLAKEWHPTKNGDLKPSQVLPAAAKKVWWICPKKHEFEATINNRNSGKGCPFCVGKKVGYGNDLQTQFPDVAKEWHPTKNGDLKPNKIVSGSHKNIWWLCSANHEWKTNARNRTANKSGCPKCSVATSRPELYFFCELSAIFEKVYHREKIFKKEIDIFIQDLNIAIEYDGVFYHENKMKKDKMKKTSIEKKGIKQINIREIPLKKIAPYDLLIHPKKEYQENFIILLKHLKKHVSIKIKSKKKIDTYIKKGAQQNKEMFSDLLSYLPGPLPGQDAATLHPHLEKEWHPIKNDNLKLNNFNPSTDYKAWWICIKGHSYQAVLYNRVGGKGCPFCAGRKIGYRNDLKSKNPMIAKQWHPTKNGDLKPSDVPPGSSKYVWWMCKNEHEWYAQINNRNRSKGICPTCKKNNT